MGVEPRVKSIRYQGQTTNFRTLGGGFAPVILLSGQGEVAL